MYVIKTLPMIIRCPGTYVLESDLSYCKSSDQPVITIYANDVVLNLRHHTLQNQGNPNATLIQISGYDNLTLKNGVFRNWKLCLNAQNVQTLTIKQIKVYNGGKFINLDSTSNLLMSKVRVDSGISDTHTIQISTGENFKIQKSEFLNITSWLSISSAREVLLQNCQVQVSSAFLTGTDLVNFKMDHCQIVSSREAENFIIGDLTQGLEFVFNSFSTMTPHNFITLRAISSIVITGNQIVHNNIGPTLPATIRLLPATQGLTIRDNVFLVNRAECLFFEKISTNPFPLIGAWIEGNQMTLTGSGSHAFHFRGLSGMNSITVSQNEIMGSLEADQSGIILEGSSSIKILQNEILSLFEGIRIDASSSSNALLQNTIAYNTHPISNDNAGNYGHNSNTLFKNINPPAGFALLPTTTY